MYDREEERIDCLVKSLNNMIVFFEEIYNINRMFTLQDVDLSSKDYQQKQ